MGALESCTPHPTKPETFICGAGPLSQVWHLLASKDYQLRECGSDLEHAEKWCELTIKRYQLEIGKWYRDPMFWGLITLLATGAGFAAGALTL